MSKQPKPTLEDHKKYMDDEVQPYLKPLLVDILRKRPANVPEYIVEWCQTKAQQIQKTLPAKSGAAASHIAAQTPAQPASQGAPKTDDAVAEHKLGESMHEIAQEQHDLPTSEDENEHDFLPEQTPEQEAAEQMKRQSNIKKKKAISAETDNQGDDFQPPVIEKTDEQAQQIRQTLAMNFMFNNLEPNEQETVVQAMSIRTFNEGDVVITQGEDGAELFIVGDGALKCTQVQTEEEGAQPVLLREYQPGDVFGELALMYNAPRAATITATAPSTCYVLDRGTFNKIVKNSAVKRREKFENFLEKIEILTDLNAAEKAKIVDCLKTERFKKGEKVITQGEEGNKFFLIQSGTAHATKRTEDGAEETVYEYKENDYFGELALMNSELRQATITVTSDEFVVATLDSRSFSRLLGRVENILKRNAERYKKFVVKA